MANPKIEVEIGAVIDGLRKGFGESVKIIETLEKQALELDKALRAATDLPTIQNLNSQLAQTKAALNQLKSSGIDPLTKATSNYNSVGVDFARIIQDAPFGIIGVGNNITQLAGSFQVLKNQTGSTSAALKQSFASIFSSGNALILGISVLTTVLTVLQQNGFFKTEQAAKSLSERLEEYREKLQGVTKANLEGQISAQKEISNFKLLTIQAENTNISLEKRLQAVDQLKKQYPEYLKSLTDEQILTGKVGESYQNLTNDIIALSKAKALSAELDKKAGDLLTLRLQEEDRANKILELREKLQTAINNKVDAGARVAGQFTAENDDAMIIQMNIDKLIKEQLKSAEERNKIIKEQLFIESQIVNENTKGANFVKETNKGLKDNKAALDAYKDSWEVYNLGLETAENLTNKLTFSAKDYEKAIGNVLTRNESLGLVPEVTGDNAWDQYTFSVYQFRDASIKANEEITNTSTKALEFANNLNKIQDKEVKIKTDIEIPQGIADIDESKLTDFVLRLKEFNSQVSEVIENGAQQTLGDFAFAIGDALASGGNVLKAAGAALLGGLAGILNQLGQLAISTGLAVEGIKKALQTLNPAVAIGAGIALVALAGFVSSKAKSLGGGSRGGGGGGGGGSSVGSSGVGGGTSFTGGGAQGGLFESQRDLNGELVVRGQDLVYVFGQANNRINKG